MRALKKLRAEERKMLKAIGETTLSFPPCQRLALLNLTMH